MRVGAKVRHAVDGQLGVLTESPSGALMVLLDRPAERREVPFRADQWQVAPDERLTPLQVARVAYACDAALRSVRGEYSLPDWIGLKDHQRLPWIQGLPSGADATRTRLYEAIRGVLG